VNGDSHYCREPGQARRARPTGPTAFKQRLLLRLGWLPVPVSLADWDAGAPALGCAERLRGLIRVRLRELDA